MEILQRDLRRSIKISSGHRRCLKCGIEFIYDIRQKNNWARSFKTRRKFKKSIIKTYYCFVDNGIGDAIKLKTKGVYKKVINGQLDVLTCYCNNCYKYFVLIKPLQYNKGK